AENALLNEGTGIGLNIVKGHIENLGGTIDFESKENVGTTFYIRMPLNVNIQNREINMSRKSILIIEDDPALRENTAELLELSDYKVRMAPNGRIGIDYVYKEKPDLIICDIMMPEVDGYGVLEAMNKNPDFIHIPFIFLSAKTEHNEIRKGMNLGADDYLTKPFTEKELLDAIESRLLKTETLLSAFQREVSQEEEEGEIRNLNELKSFFEEYGEKLELKKGEYIYETGDRSNNIYLVTKGVVKCFKI